jgi:hypothetical protein
VVPGAGGRVPGRGSGAWWRGQSHPVRQAARPRGTPPGAGEPPGARAGGGDAALDEACARGRTSAPGVMPGGTGARRVPGADLPHSAATAALPPAGENSPANSARATASVPAIPVSPTPFGPGCRHCYRGPQRGRCGGRDEVSRAGAGGRPGRRQRRMRRSRGGCSQCGRGLAHGCRRRAPRTRGSARPAWCSTTCPRSASRPTGATGSASQGSPRNGAWSRRSVAGTRPGPGRARAAQ